MENVKVFDCAILGGGPAGVTAGVYVARAGKSAVIFEGGMFGGQVASTAVVENYPAVGAMSGVDLGLKFYEDVGRNGVEVIYEYARALDLNKSPIEIKTDSQVVLAKTVILAMGVRARQLAPELENKFLGRGISYCATCDGNLFKGKDVVVIGGGKGAFGDAVYLSGLASSVTLVHRTDKFRASDAEVELAKSKGVKVLPFNVLNNVFGDQKLTGIELKNTQTGEKQVLDVDGAFISMGRVPNSEIVAGALELDEFGFVKSDDCTTNNANVFVAGDLRTKSLRQIVTATSDGAICATLALKALNNIKN